MIEAGVSAGIAIVAALAAVNTRINTRITDMDRRVDSIELRIAERYVPRTELDNALQKMEDHMIRIEQKIDQLTLRQK